MRSLIVRRSPNLRLRSAVTERPGGKSRVAAQQAVESARLQARIVWALGAGLTLLCVVFVLNSPLFAVRLVRVSGLASLTPAEAAEVEARAVLPARTNLFRARTKQLAADIERLPWVQKAEVTRHLPGMLGLHITPRASAALLTAPNGTWEVDSAGVPIRAARPNLGLPQIEAAGEMSVQPGVPVDYPGIAGAALALRSASVGLKGRVAKIEVDRDGNMCLNMVDGIAIRLGQVDDLPSKLALIRRIYTNDPSIGAKVAAIDLRSPEAPAATPRKNGGRSHDGATPRSRRHHHAHSQGAPAGSMSASTDDTPDHSDPVSDRDSNADSRAESADRKERP